jgi:hypothetical protein
MSPVLANWILVGGKGRLGVFDSGKEAVWSVNRGRIFEKGVKAFRIER